MNIHGVDLIDRDDMVIEHQKKTRMTFESESIAAWQSAGDGLYIDIGSYTGLYAIEAAKRGHMVIAFEPNPKVFTRLRQNVSANQVTNKILCSPLAVSDSECDGWLSAPSMPSISSAGSLENDHQIKFPCKCKTLDSVIQDQTVMAIKIDVEGHECSVLRGALETIQRDKPLIITEALDVDALMDQSDLLTSSGYQFEKLDERNYLWTHSGNSTD